MYRVARSLTWAVLPAIFWKRLKAKDLSRYGIELSEFSFVQAHKKFGDSISHGTIEDIPFENDFFDVITMFDLLEHVKDPVATLRRCRAILKPGGVIAADAPRCLK